MLISLRQHAELAFQKHCFKVRATVQGKRFEPLNSSISPKILSGQLRNLDLMFITLKQCAEGTFLEL